jgi:glycine cleavage system H protein
MIPKDLRYTQEHEWIRVEGKTGTVGITDHAQEALGDLTFVELPATGESLKQGEEVCAVESAKAASSIYAPMSGRVAAVNSALEEDPSVVNSDPYGAGWIYQIEIAAPGEAGKLMDAAAYEKFLAEEAH